jgi:hypothetical protein
VGLSLDFSILYKTLGDNRRFLSSNFDAPKVREACFSEIHMIYETSDGTERTSSGPGAPDPHTCLPFPDTDNFDDWRLGARGGQIYLFFFVSHSTLPNFGRSGNTERGLT